MIKGGRLLILLFWVWNCGISQTGHKIDSLKLLLPKVSQNKVGALVLADLSLLYSFRNTDSCKFYGQKAMNLSNKLNYLKGKARSYYVLGNANLTVGNIPQALTFFLKGYQLAEKNHFPYEASWCQLGMGNVYFDLKDLPKSLVHHQKGRQIIKSYQYKSEILEVKQQLDLNIGICHLEMRQLDSAAYYFDRSFSETTHPEYHNELYFFYSALQRNLGNRDKTLWYIKKGIALTDPVDFYGVADGNFIAAKYHEDIKQLDSSIYYAHLSLLAAKTIQYKSAMLRACALLGELWEPIEVKKAQHYLKQVIALNGELYGAKKVRDLQKVITQEQERLRKIEAERISHQTRLKQYAFLAGLAILLLIAFILYRNNLQKQKANSVLEKTLTTLKSTQAQLIQSEKLASLGELTAGIAHEIQNPLNFVNNFAEVSAEMLDEMHEELEKGDTTEAKAIATDLKTNLEKINHHGQRASAIVKGMLEHSRASTGVKEPTDINALADEFLRLAYHGLRAKDNDFNATMETHFDPDLPKVSVIPQDIGRVLLNLINNAFYAVHQRATTVGAPLAGAQSYEPTVTVSTKKLENAIEISVQDNGNGIPEAIRDKIFQPFFTTKPTGQGTGLGLSLAYDIVTKGHGGTLEVKSPFADESGNTGGSLFILKLNT